MTAPATRLLQNSGAILASQVVLMVLALATTPYMISRLGAERYGIFAFLVVFTSHLSYLDLGFGWALIKFVAEHEARNDTAALHRSVATALFTILVGAALAGAVVVASTDTIVLRFLRLPPPLAAEARIALWLAAGSFVLNAAMGTFNSVLKGFHRFDITSVLQIVFGSGALIGSVGMLYLGYGLPGVMMGYAAASGASLIAHVVTLRRIKPALPLFPSLDPATFRRMFSFSMFTTVNKLCIAGLFQADKFLIAYFLPVASLAYYSVAFNVAQKLNLVASNAASVMFPLASHQFSTTDPDRYTSVYRRATTVVFFLTSMFTIVLIAFARPFLRAWLGPEFATHTVAPLTALAIAFWAVSVSSVEAVSIEGAGRPRVLSMFLAIASVLNIVLCVILIPRYGILGGGVALAVSCGLLAAMDIAYANLKLFGSGLGETVRKNYSDSLILLAFAGAGTFLLARVPPDGVVGVLATMALAGLLGGLAGFWLLIGAPTRSTLTTIGLRPLEAVPPEDSTRPAAEASATR